MIPEKSKKTSEQILDRIVYIIYISSMILLVLSICFIDSKHKKAMSYIPKGYSIKDVWFGGR
jgi:hypothetical protein